MDSMAGIPVVQYTFKRSDQVTTIQSKSSEDVDGQSIHVDPELLFQSIIAIDERKALFRLELCSYPSALFDETLMPRAPQKAVLANAVWSRMQPDIAGLTGEVQHVLGGEALFHLHILLVCHQFITCVSIYLFFRKKQSTTKRKKRSHKGIGLARCRRK